MALKSVHWVEQPHPSSILHSWCSSRAATAGQWTTSGFGAAEQSVNCSQAFRCLCDLRALWSQWFSSHGRTEDTVSHRGIAVTFSSNTKISLTLTVFLIYHLPCKPSWSLLTLLVTESELIYTQVETSRRGVIAGHPCIKSSALIKAQQPANNFFSKRVVAVSQRQ